MSKRTREQFLAELWRAWYRLAEAHRKGNGKVVADAVIAGFLRRERAKEAPNPAA